MMEKTTLAHKSEVKKPHMQPPTHSQVRRHGSQSSCNGCGACRKITRSINASASLMLKSLDHGKKVCAASFLQRSYGNQYVQRLIQTKKDAPCLERCGSRTIQMKASGCCGGCANGKEEEGIPMQTKLTIGRPGDKYEQEADRVADTVMRMSEPQVQRQPEEEEEEIQMKSLSEHITPIVQKQPKEEEEELQMQSKPVVGQITPMVQRQPEEEEEEELIQAKESSGSTPEVALDMVTHTIHQSKNSISLNRRERRPEDPPRGRRPEDPPRGRRPEEERSTLSDFCSPYPYTFQAIAAEAMLRATLIPAELAMFGAEVASLWGNYLSRSLGDSLAPRIFRSPGSSLAYAYTHCQVTRDRQTELLDLIKRALPGVCPALAENEWTTFPVSTFLSTSDLNYDINFSNPYDAPGNTAGGVGSSDGGPDFRRVSGNVSFFRTMDRSGNTTSVLMRPDFNFMVRDAIDFCPGQPGTGLEQNLTLPLSRLEASGYAYDVPFEVYYNGPYVLVTLDASLITGCWPNPPAGSVPPDTSRGRTPDPSRDRAPERSRGRLGTREDSRRRDI